MAEIGSGSTDYPTGIDTNDVPESVSTTVRADVPNDLANAIVAIEGELGISPSQDKNTVLEFLQVEHNSDGTHKATKIANVEDTQTISGAKTFSAVTTFNSSPVFNSTIATPPITFAVNGSSASGFTVTNTSQVKDSIDLGTVATGNLYLVYGRLTATKGGTASREGIVIETSGTAVVDFGNGDLDSGGVFSEATAGNVWGLSLSPFIKVTTGGTLTVELRAFSLGSDSTAGDSVLNIITLSNL